jgi:hypothetical protein
MSLIGPVPVVLFAELPRGFFHVIHDLAEEVDVAADGGMVDQRLLVGEAFSAEYPADDVTH